MQINQKPEIFNAMKQFLGINLVKEIQKNCNFFLLICAYWL